MATRRRSFLSLAEGAIGWTALAATLVAALPRGGNIPLAWLALALVVFALFALQILVDLFDTRAQKGFWRLVLPGLFAVGALAWGLAQTSSGATALLENLLPGAQTLVHPAWQAVDVPGAISADPIDGRQAAVRLALTLALFFIAVRAGGSAKRAALMLRVIAVAVAALCVFGLFAAASGENAILGAAAGGAVSASFVNRNSFATYAAFGLLASLAVLVSAPPGNTGNVLRNFLERFFAGGWLFLGAFVVSATALVASASRGGAVAAAAGVAAILLVSRRGGAGRPRPVVLVVAGALVFVFAVGAAGLVGRFASAAEGMRGPVYAAIAHGIFERPLVGHGLGAFQDAFRADLPRAAGLSGEWDLAHNSYLELAFELGLPGALAFLLALALVAGRVVRGALARPGAVPLAGVGCAVAAAVHSAFDFSLQIPAVGALFAVMLGLAFAQSSPRS